MANIGRIGKVFKPANRPTPKGAAGFDNDRENVDPHVKTQAVSTKEITLSDGSSAGFVKNDASGVLSGGNAGEGDPNTVTSSANLTDIKIVQGDGGAKGVKTSNATVTQVANSAVHTAGDGSDHANVATNTTHRGLTNNPHTTTASHVGLGSVSNVATDDTAYDATTWNANLDAATKNAIRDKFESLSAGHDAVTLNANATAAGLSLATQELNYRAATNAQTGYMTASLVTSIEANVSHVADVTGDPHNIAADTLAFTNKTIDANATGNALSNIDIANCIAASQAEAEAGTENTKILTSLRVKQAIAALESGGDTASIEINVAENNLEIIELQANASVSPITHDTVIVETFFDADGYNNYVNTGNTDAIFDTDKYKRIGSGVGLIRHFKCNETSGTTLVDSSDSPSNGTVTNASIWNASGKIDRCLYFNTSYSGATSLGSVLTEWTFAMWIKWDDVSGSDYIFKKDPDDAGKTGLLMLSSTSIEFKTEGGVNKTFTVPTLSTGTWYHLVFSCTNSGNINLYINNTESSTGTLTGGTSLPNNTVRIGSHFNGVSNVIKGYGDDVRFYNIVINATERTRLYNSGTGTEVTGADTTQIIEIDLPTISGTITHTQLVVNDIDRETGDEITYDIIDTDSTGDTGQALDTKNTLTNPDGTKITGGKIKINLVPKGSSPTSGYPSVRTFALKLWKS